MEKAFIGNLTALDYKRDVVSISIFPLQHQKAFGTSVAVKEIYWYF